MDDTQFHTPATATLAQYFDRLEPAYDAGMLEDLELQDGILTITLTNGKQFLLNKHGPSQQLWLASPVSGGLHFSYDTDAQSWRLADGTTLPDLLARELAAENSKVIL